MAVSIRRARWSKQREEHGAHASCVRSASISARNDCAQVKPGKDAGEPQAEMPALQSPQKLLQLIHRRQGRAAAQTATLQSRNGVAEFHTRFQIITAQHSID